MPIHPLRLEPAPSPTDNPIDPTAWRTWLVRAACATVVVAVSLYRLTANASARYPGHADPAFYYNVAENLSSGRGASVDYVWQFLGGFPPLHHYAFDYWLPGPSVLMAAGLHFGHSVTAALNVNLAMSVLLAIGTYLLARTLTQTWWLPAAATAIVIVQPGVSVVTAQAEGGIYLAAFATCAASAAVAARRWPWLWVIAGVLAGCANLSRSEGLVLFGVLAVAAISPIWHGQRIRTLLKVTAGYLVVMMPLFVVNLRHLGAPMPRSTAQTPFINYTKIYSQPRSKSRREPCSPVVWTSF
jgi:hypothetical protein